jgi:hypothetical protein
LKKNRISIIKKKDFQEFSRNFWIFLGILRNFQEFLGISGTITDYKEFGKKEFQEFQEFLGISGIFRKLSINPSGFLDCSI